MATRTRRCVAKLADLDVMLGDLGHAHAVRAVDPAFQAAIAEVREAGLNIMMSMKGDGKPVSPSSRIARSGWPTWRTTPSG